MDADTSRKLIALNYQFYQRFAQDFSETRQRLQPGVKRILERIPRSARLLDLGCGNGQLWRSLESAGYQGLYVGLDFSTELLQLASSNSPERAKFLQADLSADNWELAFPERLFDFVLSFAVLHHLPGYELRLETLRKVRQLLSAQGQFIHSEWQFLNSPRLRARIQPWEKLGMSAGQVDPGDYLLDWRRGGNGLRYVHHFDQDELVQLAEYSGFEVSEAFTSDGENGCTGLYQVLSCITQQPSRRI